MKTDLGKVTSIQLTLAISVIPEQIAILTKGFNKFVSENRVKISLCESASISNKSLEKILIQMLKLQQEVILSGLVDLCITVSLNHYYVIVQAEEMILTNPTKMDFNKYSQKWYYKYNHVLLVSEKRYSLLQMFTHEGVCSWTKYRIILSLAPSRPWILAKSFQDISKSGSHKHCQKLWRNLIDHAWEIQKEENWSIRTDRGITHSKSWMIIHGQSCYCRGCISENMTNFVNIGSFKLRFSFGSWTM